MTLEDEVRAVLGEVLQLGDRANLLVRDSSLLGTLPELDSMAVVSVVAGLEERFAVQLDDDEISADTFSTLGTLVDLIKSKR